jgi:hypothetical protein
MSKKAFKPPRIAPLQRVRAESITDPAEQAALDKLHKRIKRKQREQEAAMNRTGAKRASNSTAKKEPNDGLCRRTLPGRSGTSSWTPPPAATVASSGWRSPGHGRGVLRPQAPHRQIGDGLSTAGGKSRGQEKLVSE